MSGIGLFLTRRLYGPEEHPRGWDKFVYDDENIHYAMLHLMCQSSGAFAQRFLDLPAKPERVSVVLEPEHGLFDLLFVVGQINHYCEVKVWATLSDTQFARQTDFLKTRHAGGLYALFTKAADAWPPDRVAAEGGGQSRAIRANGLLSTLSSLEPDLASDLRDIVVAYQDALRSLNARWPAR